jgi:hypothetical protein
MRAEVNGGDVLMIPGRRRGHHGDQRIEGSSREWSASSFASRNGAGESAGDRRGVGELRVLVSLRVRTNRRHQGMRQVMGRTTGPERGGGVLAVHRIRRFTVTGAADSGKPFRQPGGDLSLDPRGKMERESRAICSGCWSIDLAGE